MKALLGIEPKTIERTTTIEGQGFPIHEFTSDKWAAIVKPIREPKEGESIEEIVDNNLNLVIVGMEGEGYKPIKKDREQIKAMLPNGVIREYIHRLCQLNDFGFDTVKAAEKKYAAVLSNDTKSN
ncbi:MAG: hypothetical protein ACTH58_04955 [Marinomonas foliarum]|uniref:hypothetical protein n=1 Tax=Marinomonas foliarum TaxID=491950 RepID=UPI003F9B0828